MRVISDRHTWDLKNRSAAWAAWERAAVTPGMCVVDVGANEGAYAARYAQLVGPTGRVIAVEPEAANVAALRATVAAAGCAPWVTVVEAAAGPHTGTTTLLRHSVPSRHSLARIDGPEGQYVGAVTVPMIALDDLARPDAPCLIKVDAQGAEGLLLRGAARTLASPRVTWLLEIWPYGLAQSGSDALEVWDVMTAAGYAGCGLDRATQRPIPWPRFQYLSVLHRFRQGLTWHMDMIFQRPAAAG